MLSRILDWAVVWLPAIAGLVAWVSPVKEPTKKHKRLVAVGCVAFSIVLFFQQQFSRKEHEREFKNLPTKTDIAKLPSASDIVKEFKNSVPGIREKSIWGLTDAQLAKLTERESIYSSFSSGQNLINAVMGDPDSIKFADKLAEAFRAAHWTGVDGYSQGVFTKPVQGIFLQVRDQNDKPPGFFELIQTLREAGIAPKGEIDPNIPKDEFRITVGSRPDN